MALVVLSFNGKVCLYFVVQNFINSLVVIVVLFLLASVCLHRSHFNCTSEFCTLTKIDRILIFVSYVGLYC